MPTPLLSARLCATPARWLLTAAAAAVLAACGGGSDPEPLPPEPPAPAIGDLVGAQPLKPVSRAEITQALASHSERIQGVAPRYDVQTYRLTYRTHDKDGALVEASGLLTLPVKPAGQPSPVVSYQHATIFYDAEAPSNRIEGQEPPIVLASLGYIVVAADYVGFGATKGQEHPYLVATPAARAVIDMLTAAQTWRRQNHVADNGQLYMAGYSEGGYATMAAQRALELGDNPALLAQLQASFPGGGPYDVQTTLDTQVQRIRERYWWGHLIQPGLLRHLGSSVRKELRRVLLRLTSPEDADVRYQTTFMDRYMADDKDAIARESNVHQGWKPSRPVYLFHGRDDQTVPYESGLSAYNTLRAQGGSPVTLHDCTHTPSRHTECVPEYFLLTVRQMATTARDL